MFKVNGTDITLTRGDTLKCEIRIKEKVSGQEYIPDPGDTIRFAMKKDYASPIVLVSKVIPNSSMLLRLESSETKGLKFGEYVYDIQITRVNGDVDTFIKGIIELTEEVE